MKSTWASSIQSQLELLGFLFHKRPCDSYWELHLDNECVSVNKSLGDLIRNSAKELGV